jgi:predicted AlkP superfamily phosphohydrolase/phosphomutase
MLQRMGLARFERRLRSALGEKLELFPAHDRAVFPGAVDWEHTQAYSYGYHGQIFVNLRGREPQGIVEPGSEYERVLSLLEEKLAALSDPADGQTVITRMIRGSELFGDAVAWGAPDLVLLMRDLAYITRQGYEFGTTPGVIFQQPASHESGSHREDGIAVLAGPHFVQKPWRESHAIVDIAPTLLHLLGVAVPAHMDGRILAEQMAPGAAPLPFNGQVYSPVGPVSPSEAVVLTQEEEDELADRLRRLGYLG